MTSRESALTWLWIVSSITGFFSKQVALFFLAN